MISADHERAQTSDHPAFADAVTFSFADAGPGLYGLARTGLSGGRASVLVVLFRGPEPVAVEAAGDLEAEGAPWADLAAGGLRTTVAEPLERWTVAWSGADCALALEFAAASAPAELAPDHPAARAGGMGGYEQLCRVTGTIRIGTESIAIDAPGQRGHSWGAPDWGELELTRSVSAWLGDGDGVVLSSVRGRGAPGHDEEPVWAALVGAGEPASIADPRLSTTYDGDGRQRRAGLELWLADDDTYARRAMGEVICGSTLDLGQLRLDVAFMRWHADGRRGVGRYDIVRRA